MADDPVLSALDALLNANPLHDVIPIDWSEIARALRVLWLRNLTDPLSAATTAASLQMDMGRAAMTAWTEWCSRLWGMTEAPKDAAPPGGDRRFDAPEWQTHPVYRILRDAYRLYADHLTRLAETATDLPPDERQRLIFHVRQLVDAACPANLPATNPAALRRALETGGISLSEGMRNLLGDWQRGQISMVDRAAFAPGRNLAITPGKVVYRNELIELIQYTPQTPQVRAVPLMFVPPWINKYYILDLQPKNSFVRYLVQQGFTVFIISWKNPDASMEGMTFEDYMELGPLAASDVVRNITGSATINPIGYCIGGTLLVMTLSWLAAQQDRRFGTATFMVSLQDFAHVGDTAVFMDEPQLAFMEQRMMARGYLDARDMARMFNLLRPADLIWANVVNNYLLGRKPPAFDLLYWNSDGTRMARAAHSWYLRNTYSENNLIKPGGITLKGIPIDLQRIRQDLYAVGAEKDHIVPWQAAWRITRLTGGAVRFVLASSGHIAGIINPASANKGAYWVSENADAATPESWMAGATRHDGSWWSDWVDWLSGRSGGMAPPPSLGSAAHPPLMDAPGGYVLET